MARPLVLIDMVQDKVMGEVGDLQHAVSFTHSEAVYGGTGDSSFYYYERA